ncbi:MAG: adenylosuccinate synthase [Acidimicrobiia bacterium]|nr:adenylosuccinate synthase [Acidimicrobiia bacterium]
MPGVALIGTQWGDEGKGKITDLLCEEMDVVVRCTGGDNAGHTLVVGGETYKLRIVPSGILYPHALPVVGNGVVVNPRVLLEELDGLESRGVDTSRLRISGNAHLVMPYHLEIDKVTERFLGRNQLGTTKKGIGPCYADKVSRTGIRIQDLFDRKIFEQKVEIALWDKNQLLAKVYSRLGIEPAAVVEEYLGYAARLEPLLADTSLVVDEALRDGKGVLLEGAQGTFLDLDHGTYPYVTSSNPVASGMCTGAGIGPLALGRIIGITKAYTTRVGAGPFPTELFDEDGETLGRVGAEFGTVTGRKRRCGWFDSVLVRYAARVNSLTSIALTKLDVLGAFETVKVCVGYDLDGTTLTEVPFNQSEFHHVTPIYEELAGWGTDISAARSFDDLPAAARSYVEFVEDRTGVEVGIVSVGADRSQTLFR